MKTFNLLPTDQRFLDLTDEQREYIWHNYLIDNPELEKKLKNRFDDPEFDKEWDKLDEEPQEGSSKPLESLEGNGDQEDYDEIEASYEAFIQGNEDMRIPDYREVLKAKGIALDNPDEWEEVDD
jgi:hypothetical protein